MSVKRTRLAGLAGAAFLLTACGGKLPLVSGTPAPPAASAVSGDSILDQLMAGDTGAARKQLKVLLKREPMNPAALLLKDSIEHDAKELLGPENYVYAVRPGDTVVGLAQRLLGNRLKAYQLLRYNGLTAPAVLTPGQQLRIPGQPPRVEPIRRPEPAPARPAASTDKPKPAAARPATNPAAARQARAAGLTALNQGNVDRAVALLRRAAALDPGNALIARDLVRAERIAATVRARK